MDKQKIQEKLLDDSANVVRSGPEAIATASGVLLGAMTGALAGPAGAIAGAFVGGVVGLVTGAVSEDERQELEARTRDQQRERNDAVPSAQRVTLSLFFQPQESPPMSIETNKATSTDALIAEIERDTHESASEISAIGAASGIVIGAMTGAMAGPAGALAGAIIGGVVGTVSGVAMGEQREEEVEAHLIDDRMDQHDDEVLNERLSHPPVFPLTRPPSH